MHNHAAELSRETLATARKASKEIARTIPDPGKPRGVTSQQIDSTSIPVHDCTQVVMPRIAHRVSLVNDLCLLRRDLFLCFQT
jgi:hypothetical protein